MLLFSNKEHPAVSLKLHDADTDLSLCTVLDYYLDNVVRAKHPLHSYYFSILEGLDVSNM